MDDVDHSQMISEMYLSQALKAHFETKNPPQSPFVKGEGKESVCIDCGEEIDPGRLAAKPDAVRCIDCQGKRERKRHGIV